ncbi:vasoactive intestinal polypeptide receptor 1 isoform X1 [Sorex araneus]|uniref:vasoactive intestinal polypeptide receptor 1 isoform X1 n=1 Tax=Sorex araneus TaxID=42254 RepID=UPI0024337950|nr:vasoactive intestinal polypeptide receptor 1 isoform X1 [Sorex araneus]
MRPPRPPPAPWLCVLFGALACARGPSGGLAAGLQREECIYLKTIEEQHQQCLEEAKLENETEGCGKMWDNLTCWPATPRSQVVVLPCPPIFKIFSSIEGRNVSRTCTDKGWADLEPGPYPEACGLEDRDLDEHQTVFYSSVKTGYTVGYSLSLAALVIAMTILTLFRKLHCTRNYIHMHLFISFILRAVAVFIKDFALFDSGQTDHCEGSVGCKAAVVLFQYCVMANYFWLLVEGLYLYTLLAVSFFSERKYFWGYILIGWGVPSTFTMIWTIVRIHFENYGCWDTIDSPLWWIIKAPILASILVNFILFICIIRILVQKLRPPEVMKSNSSPYSASLWKPTRSPSPQKRPDTVSRGQSDNAAAPRVPFSVSPTRTQAGPCGSHICGPRPHRLLFPAPRRLAKSTLLLIPLFGVHYIMFAFFPDDFKPEVKMVFELVMGSFQGFVVAILYCFLNGEVQGELRRKWRRWHLQGILGLAPRYQHAGSSSNATCSTQVSMLTRVSPDARRSSSFQAEVSVV